jgi:hypothetical protein
LSEGLRTHQDEYPFARPRELEWLASRGFCDPQTASEYVGRKLFSRQVFAQARKEYQRATANYASAHYPESLGKFTVRKPDEYPLLEIWHLGLGPNVSDDYCVVPRSKAQLTDDARRPNDSQMGQKGFDSDSGPSRQQGQTSSRRNSLQTSSFQAR